jgi:hypothetical protein
LCLVSFFPSTLFSIHCSLQNFSNLPTVYT